MYYTAPVNNNKEVSASYTLLGEYDKASFAFISVFDYFGKELIMLSLDIRSWVFGTCIWGVTRRITWSHESLYQYSFLEGTLRPTETDWYYREQVDCLGKYVGLDQWGNHVNSLNEYICSFYVCRTYLLLDNQFTVITSPDLTHKHLTITLVNGDMGGREEW